MATGKHICKECGGDFDSRQYNASFCSDGCKRTFNNRRAKRGAILYDLLMIETFDPDAFKKSKLQNRREELLQRWRGEDDEANRKRSWKRPNEVMYDTAAMLR